MGSDLFLVSGVILAALALPALLNAYSEGRAPRGAALLIVAAGGCIVYAVMTTPTGYTLRDVPHAFARVFAMFLN